MKMYLAVYGTLIDHNGVPFALGKLPREILAQLVDSGSFKIKGTLYDLGAYPGLVLQGETPIHGRLLEIKDPQILKSLDAYEEYDPERPEESEYIRRFVMLDEPKVAAWIYVYNRDVSSGTVVTSGQWRKRGEVFTVAVAQGS